MQIDPRGQDQLKGILLSGGEAIKEGLELQLQESKGFMFVFFPFVLSPILRESA